MGLGNEFEMEWIFTQYKKINSIIFGLRAVSKLQTQFWSELEFSTAIQFYTSSLDGS